MKRGSVYWVNLEPTEPPEFGKIRPGVIVSNSEQNIRLPTVVILPFSTRAPEIWPLRIEAKIAGKRAFAVIPGIRQVNKLRLHGSLGVAAPEFLDRLDQALAAYLRD